MQLACHSHGAARNSVIACCSQGFHTIVVHRPALALLLVKDFHHASDNDLPTRKKPLTLLSQLVMSEHHGLDRAKYDRKIPAQNDHPSENHIDIFAQCIEAAGLRASPK
jgi:hypothetical protein